MIIANSVIGEIDCHENIAEYYELGCPNRHWAGPGAAD